jgi:hypothetical protein
VPHSFSRRSLARRRPNRVVCYPTISNAPLSSVLALTGIDPAPALGREVEENVAIIARCVDDQVLFRLVGADGTSSGWPAHLSLSRGPEPLCPLIVATIWLKIFELD